MPAAGLGEDPLVRLVGRIYEGALDPDAWPGIVQAIIAFVGGSKGLLLTPSVAPQSGGLVVSWRFPESALQQWADHYIQHDVWTQAGMAKGLFREGNVVVDTDLVPEREFLSSTLYTEFFKPLGVGRLCSGVVFGQTKEAVLPTVCSVYRDITEDRFGERECKQLRMLMPHLSRSLGVMYRLRDAELKTAATLAALDGLTSGILLLDANARLTHANRRARELLDSGDGIRIGAGSLVETSDTAAQIALRKAIESALRRDVNNASHFSGSVLAPRRSGVPPLVLQFAPLPDANGFSRSDAPACAILFVNEPDRPIGVDPAVLRKLYGITPAEARVAERLCAGDTLLAAAANCGVSESTVRTQLGALFQKTRTNRQAELMRLLVAHASADR